MRRKRLLTGAAGLLALAACGDAADEQNAAAQEQPKAEPVRPSATELPPGTTPMAQRVAVLGLLNKRNGISRELRLRPGEAVRDGNVIVRLQACDKTAPWEPEQLTAAFVQVDVANPQGQFQRVFSGWLYRESPSLNVVEHPVYDVDTKSCEMTHPASAGGTEAPEGSESSNSSAPKAGTPARRAVPRPADSPRAKASPPAGNRAATPSNSADSNDR